MTDAAGPPYLKASERYTGGTNERQGMFELFDAETADDLWQRLSAFFGDARRMAAQASRAGDTHEILHAALTVRQPRQRWMPSRTPPVNPAFAIAEVIWIVAGRRDARFLNFFNTSLPKFAGDGPTYHGAYGYRLRRHFGLDQLERAFEVLSNRPEQRQVTLQIWDPAVDLPAPSGAAAAADIPCNITSLLKVRGGRLEWLQVMRSNDVYRGLPYNVVQFTALQEVLAGWLGLELGSYNHVSDSLHIYAEDVRHLNGQDGPRPEVWNADSIALRKEQSEQAFADAAALTEQIIGAGGADEVRAVIDGAQAEPAFLNMLLVLGAEAARRHRSRATAQQLVERCTNPVYRYLWDRWAQRVGFRAERPSGSH